MQERFKTTDDGNPRKSDIDTSWWPIRDDLQNGNGRAVSDALVNFKETDPPLWNAIYWRVHGWLAGYMTRFPANDSEVATYGEDRPSLGRARLVSFLTMLYPKRDMPSSWESEDIVFILQELGKIGRSSAPKQVTA
jgi:hypothetical protein